MLLQWIITAALVGACAVYVIQQLLPKAVAATSGCGTCRGCAGADKPCASGSTIVLEGAIARSHLRTSDIPLRQDAP